MSLSATHFKPVIQVTLAYIVLWYIFLYSQSIYARITHAYSGKGKDGAKLSLAQIKYGSPLEKGKSMLRFDRTVGNTMEQMMPFLVSLWLHAAFVDVDHAASLGWYYILSRLLYPFLFLQPFPFILISTIPGYAIIVMLLWPVYSKL